MLCQARSTTGGSVSIRDRYLLALILIKRIPQFSFLLSITMSYAGDRHASIVAEGDEACRPHLRSEGRKRAKNRRKWNDGA